MIIEFLFLWIKRKQLSRMQYQLPTPWLLVNIKLATATQARGRPSLWLTDVGNYMRQVALRLGRSHNTLYLGSRVRLVVARPLHLFGESRSHFMLGGEQTSSGVPVHKALIYC